MVQILRTDHKALVWLRQKKDLNRKLLNMKLELEEYEFDVTYKKGTLNRNADALSRIEPEKLTTAEIHATREDSMTQHSADTDDGDFIPSTEKPLNEFRNQIVLEQSSEESTETSVVFRHHMRVTIKKNKL